ncbi:major facilitator superfamily domain-containing protein [Mycena rosella]|uniref:Major facilitator superfamily domain-containing protein n=1 Tax=Mycena rosella TaxID=1033263 RepID=A0AAD7CTQ7_MYCRO|nr:major facilitator superfamily domain-containing protein [Mycena rosella]
MPSSENHDAETLHDSPTASKIEKSEYPATTPAVQAGDDFPHGIKLALLTLALCLSVFLVALDNTIIATAIPKITDQFKSLDDVGWYGSAYLLTTAATQLLFGKFYTFMPIKWVYVAAIVLFEVGSVVCGAAPNSTALIIGRAIAGLGSAGIFSGAMIIVAHTVPLAKRPIYSGMIGGMYGIASVAGPLMGGAFTDRITWRWCFYINLPIGAVTLLVVIFLFKMPRSGVVKAEPATFMERVHLFDPWGTLVFIPAIICLLLALQWGGSKYPWGSGRIIALFVVFGVLISIFIGVQFWKQDRATIPPRILKKRSIWSSSAYAFSIGASFFILSFYLPIWFQAIRGVSAVHSGIDNLPMILSLVVGSILAGGVITQVGYYTPFMLASSVMTAVGAGLISTLKVNSGHTKWMPFEIIFGLGAGLGMQQPMLAAQNVLELKDVPIGTSIIMFSQTLGGALFISIAQNVFTNKLVSGLLAKVPSLSPAVVLSAGATSLKTAIDPQFLGGVLEAYNEALVAAFYVSIAMACLSLVGSLFVEWRSIKGKDIEMSMGA